MVVASEAEMDPGAPAVDALLEREFELELLSELAEEAGAGRGRTLLLEAAPGMGKSALLERGTSAAREAGLAVLRARGHQLERGFAWGIARSLFEALLACPRS